MAVDLMPPILTGSFALGGGLGGVVLTGWLTRRNEKRRLAAEDARRWLADRRRIYAAYLVLAESMLRQIDGLGVFLSYDGSETVSEDDEAMIHEGLFEYHCRWDDELQPALLEVQLMATPTVADLADRVSGALMEITGVVELRGTFTDYYPGWFQARDLFEVLRNAMRAELGLPEALSSVARKEDDDWPWLSSRPDRDSYVQNHMSSQRSLEASMRNHPSHQSSEHVDVQDQAGDGQPPSGDHRVPVTPRSRGASTSGRRSKTKTRRSRPAPN
jgi:hypothetical protein